MVSMEDVDENGENGYFTLLELKDTHTFPSSRRRCTENLAQNLRCNVISLQLILFMLYISHAFPALSRSRHWVATLGQLEKESDMRLRHHRIGMGRRTPVIDMAYAVAASSAVCGSRVAGPSFET